MQRTEGQTRRRRHLAEASLARTSVALYVATHPRDSAAEDLAELRRYAHARDWDVTEEVTDDGPAGASLESRSEWPRIRLLIESGHVRGLVVPSLCVVGRRRLLDWLADRNAFAVSVAECTHDGECTP
ncbi:recombinase family protein [Streptomyces sp. N2-109]|uniref:Recombinase family protein n=1 Tax=Streptomyces gossypii TaxID=2883101 RepID=A0ABT2JTG6_9ACTN|nr:recombinase family protein [Streptomyces gossypii]MCT2591165.1 recombinase family protein [Streptomyces gossypii]